MTLTAKEYDMRVDEFYKNDLREAVKEILLILMMDFGQKFVEEEVQHVVDRITDKLIKKYPTWKLNHFSVACEKGKLGHFSGATGTKITVRLIEQWLWQYNEIRMKEYTEQQVRIINSKKPDLSQLGDPDSSIYAAAMKWKISNLELLRGQWDKYPISKVVTAFKTGKIHKLNDELNGR